ncbi:MAG: hypothetical protein ACO1PI_15515 [Bacteroidota bacterium]
MDRVLIASGFIPDVVKANPPSIPPHQPHALRQAQDFCRTLPL